MKQLKELCAPSQRSVRLETIRQSPATPLAGVVKRPLHYLKYHYSLEKG
ncbi:MAG: hypothetical protein JWM11_3991 [Planctomycetaceae bacterium]|nr:hypothetical protein [Planctomycetaceae bacterium]